MKRNCCFAFTTLSFTAQHLRTSIIWHFSMHCIHCELPNVKCQMWAHQCEIWNMGSPMWNFKCELTNVKWSLSSLNSQLKLILPPAISSTWIIMEIPMMILSKKILIKAMVIRLRTMLIKMMKLLILVKKNLVLVTSFLAAATMPTTIKQANIIDCFIVDYFFVTLRIVSPSNPSGSILCCAMSLKCSHTCNFGAFVCIGHPSDILRCISCTLCLADWLLHLLWCHSVHSTYQRG